MSSEYPDVRIEEVPSDFQHPTIHATEVFLREHFSRGSHTPPPLRNPHYEAKVGDAARLAATPAAVLLPIVRRGTGLTLLLTRRHEAISYPGHVCFPGGRRDPTDASFEETALREAEEEISLPRSRVEVLGRLGDYVTHSGYRIVPVVALVSPPFDLVPRPGEVEEILEIPLDHTLRSDSYRLGRIDTDRAHFFLRYREAVVSGPTVSVLMGFYEDLIAPGHAVE